MAAQLEEVAQKTIDNIQERNQQAALYVRQYVDLIKSKHLPVNTGEIGKKTESAIVDNLRDIAIYINNDESEQSDGMGSVTLLTLLLKVCLLQRNRINELEYRLVEEESRNKDFERRLVKLEKNVE